ncbi:MAG: PLP-dependent aspartate aminotransferase family protein [Acidobacteriia bacterium]|nr:PLP-dependent aspartate aminotransferase family protein [Terriglobia bacterium]
MNRTTKALHCRINAADARSSVTPLYQCSAFQAGSPYFYTRKNNPNIAEFEAVIATLEDARYAVAVTTGMAALSTALQLLSPGDTLVVNKDIYGCSYKLFQRVAARMQFVLKTLDLSSRANIGAVPERTRMVIFETPTNPFLKTVDIAAVAEEVKGKNPDSLILVDNTWATPLFQHPLALGADISMHSATKYFSGHSDVMGGVLLTDRADLHEELRSTRFYHGTVLDPHSAWLLRRSMQTFAMRMKHHHEVAADIKGFLATRPQVAHVYYPAIDGCQLTGYGSLIFFDLREDLADYYDVFTANLKLFDTGTGMACVTSMVAQPYTGSHASMTPEEKAEMGLDRKLVRLSLGLEDPDDLKEDLANALDAMEGKVVQTLSRSA